MANSKDCISKNSNNRSHNLQKNFAISEFEYDLMLKKQNGVCVICKQPENIKNKHLSIDHNHTTSKIRGLLCQKCNTMLGMAKDDINILENAIAYLRRNQ